MAESEVTTDHDVIRDWAEERNARPATVKGTAGKGEEAGVLRLDFEPWNDELEELSWDEFFEKFEAEHLAFLYQEETSDGSVSRFHKFIERSSDR